MDQEEIWLSHPEYPEYSFSSEGRVMRTVPRGSRRAGSFVVPFTRKSGYSVMTVRNPAQKQRQVFVHVILCEIFHGPRPSQSHQVAHWDGVRSNNRATNLRWATARENSADKFRHGTVLRGSQIGISKLSEADVRRASAMKEAGFTYKQIAEPLGVTIGAIASALNGRSWRHLNLPKAKPAPHARGWPGWRSGQASP